MGDAPDKPTIFLAGGGTGGHLYPGIAVAESLRQALPDANLVFLCTSKEIDRVILEPTGFEFVPQSVQPLPRLTSVGALLKFWRGWRETKDLVRKLIRERRPAAVLGLGGYAAGVAVKVAAMKGVPTAIVNPDLIPGRANQYLMQYVQAVCCQFAETADHVAAGDREKLKVTGCPIRDDIRRLAEARDVDVTAQRAAARRRLGLDPSMHTLLVTGASLGAQTVNEAVIEMLKGVTLRGWQILHLSGRDHAESVRAGYRDLSLSARVIDFTADMADIWAVADVAISRSGASSCAELTACGVPSILMPYPFHKDLHQRANAKALADAGAAILVDDEKDRRRNADKLRPAVESLLYDAPRRQAMAAAARKLGHPDAAARVAQVVTAMAGISR
jgi:UDP-N-acetylglucosamine--N-acetylmuramyl-(pentapeptide) pyrophosphoryl-undecaprenol N-acetylglucosamine transferase